MRRWLWNIAVVASALLLVATLVLWVRSYRVSDQVQHTWDTAGVEVLHSHGIGIDSLGGELLITVSVTSWTPAPGWDWKDDPNPPTHWPPPDPWRWESPPFSIHDPMQSGSLRRLRFGFATHAGGRTELTSPPGRKYVQTSHYRQTWIPLWFIALLSTLSPAWWLRHLALIRPRQRRRERGLCEFCGYDLRASNERCPECGGERKTDKAGGTDKRGVAVPGMEK